MYLLGTSDDRAEAVVGTVHPDRASPPRSAAAVDLGEEGAG